MHDLKNVMPLKPFCSMSPTMLFIQWDFDYVAISISNAEHSFLAFIILTWKLAHDAPSGMYHDRQISHWSLLILLTFNPFCISDENSCHEWEVITTCSHRSTSVDSFVAVFCGTRVACSFSLFFRCYSVEVWLSCLTHFLETWYNIFEGPCNTFQHGQKTLPIGSWGSPRIRN